MRSTMTVAKRFTINAGVLLLLSTALGVVAIIGFNSVSKAVKSLAEDSIPGIRYSQAMRADVNELRALYLRHLLETSSTEKQKVDEMILADQEILDRDIKGYEDSIFVEEDRQNFSKLLPEIAAMRQGWTHMQLLSRAGKNAEAFEVCESEALVHINAAHDQLIYIVDWNKKAADKTIASSEQSVRSSVWITAATTIVALVLGIGLAWFMVAALNKQLIRSVADLAEGAEQIVSAAAQVSASSQSLAQGSSEQAASIEETSASSEEINSMAHKNSDNCRAMATLVGQSQATFDRTNHELEAMIVSMQQIHQSSEKISRIIKVIDEIAFQTNILALNAAVEAARAGEAGMGFAVVADEVRSLAQRSAQAAKDTALLIEESISSANGGKDKMDEVASAIRAITEDSRKIKVLVDEVTLGSEEQTRGLEQIARGISQMEQVTQTAAANAEESAAAAEELNAQSNALKTVVSELEALVRSDGSLDVRASESRRARTPAPAQRASRTLPADKPSVEPARRKRTGKESFPLEAAFKEF